jgi:UDP-N-acetyl-D-mannosaminuronate dehydrogenase
MSGKINGVNVGNLAGRLEYIQILSSDSTEIIKQLRKETKDVNTKNGYEELMRVRDDGERVNIYFKEKKNKKNEFVLIADESDEYTIISIVGELTLQEMQEMVSGL